MIWPLAFAALAMFDPFETRLEPKTLAAFDAYMREADSAMQKRAQSPGSMMWGPETAERRKQLRAGQIVVAHWSRKGMPDIPSGMVHDWVAAAYLPGVKGDRVAALLRDTDRQKQIYAPEVVESKRLPSVGEKERAYLRFLKKKVMTVVLDMEFDLEYRKLDTRHWQGRIRTTKMVEVAEYGSKDQRALEPDTGHGFLWRLNSYWQIEEVDGGTYIECRAISLTRDIPFLLKPIVQPMTGSMARESLEFTLAKTRAAVQGGK